LYHVTSGAATPPKRLLVSRICCAYVGLAVYSNVTCCQTARACFGHNATQTFNNEYGTLSLLRKLTQGVKMLPYPLSSMVHFLGNILTSLV